MTSSLVIASVEDALSTLLLRARASRVQSSDEFVEHLSHALAAARAALGWETDPAAASVRGGLAAWQLRIAFDRLAADTDLHAAVVAAAQACRISRGHFSRAFKTSTGMAPSRWHMEHRIRLSEHLLRQLDIPLAEVAGRCGFADQSHFTNAFTRLRHVSPGAWRRQMAGAPPVRSAAA